MNVAVLNKTAKAIILLILTRQEPHSEKSNCPRHRFELVARIQRPRCGNLPSVFGGEPELRHQPLGDSTKVSPAGGSRSCVAPTLEGGGPEVSKPFVAEDVPRRSPPKMKNPSHFRIWIPSSGDVFGGGTAVERAEHKSLSRPKSFWEGGSRGRGNVCRRRRPPKTTSDPRIPYRRLRRRCRRRDVHGVVLHTNLGMGGVPRSRKRLSRRRPPIL